MKKVKETSVWLSDPILHKDVIALYLKKAQKAGFNKLNFIAGGETQVRFSVIIS